MDTLFLGVFNVIPCSDPRIFGGKPTRTLCRTMRAKIYAANMINDLQKDTLRLSIVINEYKTISSKLDSFNIVLSRLPKPKTGMLYYFGGWLGKIFFFVPNNSTLEQLKNSGSLRYF